MRSPTSHVIGKPKAHCGDGDAEGCKNRKQDRSAEGSVRPGDACFHLVHVSFTFFQLQA
jgi:hypothetical protein